MSEVAWAPWRDPTPTSPIYKRAQLFFTGEKRVSFPFHCPRSLTCHIFMSENILWPTCYQNMCNIFQFLKFLQRHEVQSVLLFPS